jgi:tetratricopeptide (TPR) repeat protein
VEKLTKHDLQDPDMFLSWLQRAYDFLLNHVSKIIGTIIFIVLLGAGWAGYSLWNESRELKAQELLFQAEDILKKADEAAKKTLTKIPNLETDYKDAVAGFNNVIENYPSSQARVMASIELTSLYLRNQKTDLAIETLSKASLKAKHAVVKGLLWYQMGIAFEAKGECQKAIDQWQNIERSKDVVFLHGTTLVSMGLCYEKLNQFDKAEAIYKKAQGLTSDPDASRTAKRYLRLIKKAEAS